MTTIINAVSGTGLTQSADGSGIVKLQSNGVTTNALAWVNFNGTTSPGTIRSQYNVSSVTKNGTGDYTLNFTSNLSDANYAVNATAGQWTAGTPITCIGRNLDNPVQTVSQVRLYSLSSVNAGVVDNPNISVTIFGN